PDDLERIARFIEHAGSTVICGSAGLIGHLQLGTSPAAGNSRVASAPTRIPQPTLVVCGSLNPAATAQVDALSGAIDAPVLIMGAQKASSVDAENLLALLDQRSIAVLMTERHPETAKPSVAMSEEISQQLAQTVKRVDRRRRIGTLVLLGGRTAYHVCRELRISGVGMTGLVEHSLPLCVTLGPSERMLMLKPGGFGDSCLLARSLKSLVA